MILSRQTCILLKRYNCCKLLICISLIYIQKCCLNTKKYEGRSDICKENSLECLKFVFEKNKDILEKHFDYPSL